MIHKSEQINEIAKALAQAQSEMKAAKKDAKNPFFKSDYATLESVSDACLHVLNKNGIAVTQTTAHFESSPSVSLETTLIHSSGQWIGSVYPVHPTKNDPQSLGSALTYARRYSLAAIAGVVTSDDDGEAAMNRDAPERAVIAQKEYPKNTPSREYTGNTPSYDARHSAKMNEFISEKQVGLMMAVATENGWSEDDVKEYWAKLGIKTRKEVNKLQLDAFLLNVKKFPKTA